MRRCIVKRSILLLEAIAMVSLGACSSNDNTEVPDTTVPETAVPETAPETATTPEIDQLLDDYRAAWNAYDADAMRPLLTEDFHWYFTNPDPRFGVSTGWYGTPDLDRTLTYVGGSAALNKIHFEWVGEPIMTGDGPWLVSWAWHGTSANYEHPEQVGISTYTIVDEDGTLKIARAIEVPFDTK